MSRRVAQKQAARVVREQLAAERRRRRTLWVSVIAVVVLVLAGGIGYAVYAGQRADSYTAPTGAVADGTGIPAGTGPTTVDVYEDFMCPHCKTFEETAGPTLDQLVADGKVRVVYHPIAYLDRFSTTRYSTRAAAASGCAATAGKFREYAEALFARQPPEGGAGLTDDELIQVGTSVGLTGQPFSTCVRDGTYRPWTQHVTDAASARGITGTPTVMVAGRPVQPLTTQAITSAVAAATR